MTDISYKAFVRLLAKPGEDILSSLTPFKCQLMHAAIGFAGEALELSECVNMRPANETIDAENFIEELGDIEFFLEHLRDVLDLHRHTALPAVPHDKGEVDVSRRAAHVLAPLVTELACLSGSVLDHVKKHVIYNKPLVTEPIFYDLLEIEDVLQAMRVIAGLSRDDVLNANRAKLAKRYSDLSYSDAAAQARADKA